MATSPNQPAPQELGPELTNDDGAPAGGYTFAKATTNSAGTVKVKGTDGNDRVTFNDIYRDTDQVINTGAGDDIFYFRADESLNPKEKVNAIIDFGSGGNDIAVFAFSVSEYKFTFRSDGVKVQYVGADGTESGPAITFKGAEQFIFRNIVETEDGTANYKNTTYTPESLGELIGFPVAGSGVEA